MTSHNKWLIAKEPQMAKRINRVVFSASLWDTSLGDYMNNRLNKYYTKMKPEHKRLQLI